MYIASIGDAAKMILQGVKTGESKLAQDCVDYVRNNRVAGSADAFHNAGADLARRGIYDKAIDLVEVGCSRNKNNTDLLADLIKYKSEVSELDSALDDFEKLKAIPYKKWTWRAYVFSIDFLMAYYDEIEEDKEEYVKDEILGIISKFKEFKPNDERAYVAESELYEMLHDEDKQIQALKDGMEKISVCPQCLLKYADFLFARGKYSEVIPVAQRAVNIREDQPSISLGYTYYILAMSTEFVYRKEHTNLLNRDGGLDEIYKLYKISYSLFADEDGREHLMKNIEKRVKALEIETETKSGIKIIDPIDPKEQLLRMLGSRVLPQSLIGKNEADQDEEDNQ